MNSRILRHGRIAAAAIAVVVAATACKSDRATVFEPYGPNSYDFHLSNADDIASAGLPAGTVTVTTGATATTPGTVKVTLDNLHALSGSVYKVWIAEAINDDLVNVSPLVGNITVTDAAGNETTTANASTFNGGAGTTIVIDADATTFGSNPSTAQHNVVFVSIESGTGTSDTPSATQPLWALYTVSANPSTPVTANMTFGAFAKKAADRYAYFINGHGEGGVRGTTLIVDDSSLARPPIGYYYGAFLVNADASDTLYLGELTAPFPRRNISLRDADASVVDPVVQTNPPLITTASILFDGSKAGLTGTLPYEGWTNFFIALIAKQGVQGELPPNVVTSGTLPTIVTTAPAP